MLAQYEERLTKYENEIRAARARAFADFEARRREMLNERAKLIASAREDVRAQVDAAKNEIAVESREARRQLETEARTMAEGISERLINQGSRSMTLPLLTTPVFGLLASEGLDPLGIPKLVNLIIFVGILYYLLRKPARAFFARRLADVRSTLDRAAKDKETATTKLKDIDARLARLEVEIAEIQAQTDHEAEAERARIQRDTEKEAERLRQLAKREIDIAKFGALVELRKFAADKSVELAEQMIRNRLTVEDDRRLVDRASAGLPGVN